MSHTLNNLKQTMLDIAQEIHGFDIEPTHKAGTWDKSFIVEGGCVYFWFNTVDGSTHMMTETLNGKENA